MNDGCGAAGASSANSGCDVSCAAVKKQATSYGSRHGARLTRFPLRWNYLIEKEALRAKELEHVLIEKVEQLFWNKLQERTQTRAKACVCACRYQGFVRSWHPVRWRRLNPEGPGCRNAARGSHWTAGPNVMAHKMQPLISALLPMTPPAVTLKVVS